MSYLKKLFFLALGPNSKKKGQGLIEYLIIVAIIGVATMGIMRVLSQNIRSRFAKVTYAIQGKTGAVTSEAVKESHFKKSDMSDFFQGASTGAKD